MSEPPSEALADALRRLKTAERTAAELRAALLKNYPEAEVEAALAWLTTRKLLSETRAAEATVTPRITGRKAEGDIKLRQRLEARGTDLAAIDQTLSSIPDASQRMQEALTAKFRTPNPGDRGRAGRFLLSRGFEEDEVEGALERFFAPEDSL